jgi:hypothetical protein
MQIFPILSPGKDDYQKKKRGYNFAIWRLILSPRYDRMGEMAMLRNVGVYSSQLNNGKRTSTLEVQRQKSSVGSVKTRPTSVSIVNFPQFPVFVFIDVRQFAI